MSTSDSAIATLKRLYRTFPPVHRRRLHVLLFVMIVGALAEIVTLGAVLPFLALIANPDIASDYPLLTTVFSYVGWNEGGNLLVPVTILFACAAVTAGAIRVLLSWLTARFVFLLGHALVKDVYRRILYQPYVFHVARNSSETVAALQKVHRVTQGVLLSLMQSIIGVAIGLCIVTALIIVDPVVSLLAFSGFGILYILVGKATKARLARNSEVVAATQQQRIQAVQEGLGGIRELLIDSSQPVFLRKFSELDRAYSGAQITTTFIGESPRFIIEAAGMVLIALLALFLSTRAGGIQAGLPTLGALALGSQRLLPLMQLIHVARTRIRANWDILHEVLELLELEIDETQQKGDALQLSFKKALSLDSVDFRYEADDEALVLKGVSLEVPRGSRLGIIGTTGSGKSTAMDLMMALLKPTAGLITVDGVAIDDTTRLSWQSRIAHVPQVIFLSDASLAENIAFGVPPERVDIERVTAAAKQAQLDDFIQQLPDKYDTDVGERGVRLSGGQRQRVGIARALYKRATLLVFDEATSALDTDTEAAVMEAINALGKELTLIIVAHRLSTVAGCDKIVRLEDGEIAAIGSYAQIVETEGRSQS